MAVERMMKLMKAGVLKYKDYIGTVEYSAQDGVLFGKIIGIGDLVLYEGSSVEELTKAFNEAVDDYTKTCSLVGKDPEKHYSGSFNVRVNPDIHRMLEIAAETHKTNLNNYVKVCIVEKLKNENLLAK